MDKKKKKVCFFFNCISTFNNIKCFVCPISTGLKRAFATAFYAWTQPFPSPAGFCSLPG